IELAAARSKVLTPPALLARLDSRLKTLTGGGRDRTARQQTLRGAIDWSYSLLEAAEQVLLARLGVFAGGGTFAAIEAVINAGDPIDMDLLDGLASLMDKSLIRQLEDTDGEPRFVQFETIREYALERLEARGEAARMRRQHVEYYLGVVEEATPELTGPHQEKWLKQLDHEHGNLRAALDWTLRTPGAGPDVCELGVRLAGALWRFWEIRGHINEGRTWLTLALAVRCDPAVSRVLSARARVLTGAGNLAWAQGAYAEARALHEQSLAQYQQLGDQHGSATALGNLGLVALSQGDRTTARTFHVASLSLRRELGDQRGIATTLNSLAGIALDEGDDATAHSLYEESLALLRDVGDRRGVAYALGNLGLVAINEGDLDAARGLYEESLGLRRELGDKRGIASALNNLGVLALEQGNIDAARACYEESLALRRELGDRAGIAVSLANLAAIAIDQNDYHSARTLYGESLTLQFQLQAPDGIAACVAGLVRAAAGLHDDERAARLAGALAAHVDVSGDYGLGADDPGLDDAIAAVRARLGDQAWIAAWEGGKGMSLTETVAYAIPDLHGAGVAGIAAP
ncbi:MAG TPA: tetratricopeptide repeat protein, partial [Herpetosiphonaceae bacterium]|nr:tetratricopeptide repeat protein [Herpetosiphonaceae bacterium]